MKKFIWITLTIAVLVLLGFVTIRYYPFIFAKSVNGQIVRVEKVNQPEAVIASGANIPASQLFSFAIAIRDEKGEIHTASSEDRQWAVAQSGQCAEAKLFPYPPWELTKSGTYYGARLVRLFDCPAHK